MAATNIDLQPSRRFANITQAKALAMQVHGSDKAIWQAYLAEAKKRGEADQRRLQKWERSEQNSRVPHLPVFNEKRRNYDRGHNLILRAIAIFPYWDRQTRTLEPGVYCQACTYDAEKMPGSLKYQGTIWDEYPSARWDAYHREFLEDDIPDHFLNCPAVKQNYDFQIIVMVDKHKRKGTNFTVRPRKTSGV
ncbi:uncharacterized protein KD926_007688 [Aspergillus affinis]|uniref:uncharacterized protein n=1 Tax=Aspergillus affinis TaxID=1070780 RepID=UPI0022FE88FA|nr:uncharacterized protein KD926_007688 [Aspergillus affinis]KAI9040746.1 hypothetical protein KD926_007688 [Aspergillus affinis]